MILILLSDWSVTGDIVQRFNIPEAGAISKTKNEARLERDFQPLVEILMQKYKVILVSDWSIGKILCSDWSIG